MFTITSTIAVHEARSKWEETTQKCIELSATSASQEAMGSHHPENEFLIFGKSMGKV